MELTKLKWLLVFLVCLQCANTISGLTCCETVASEKEKCESPCTATGKVPGYADGKPACVSQKTTSKVGGKEIIDFSKGCSIMPSSGGSCTTVEVPSRLGAGHTYSCFCTTDKCNQFHASITSAPKLNVSERLTPKLLVGTIGLAIFFNFYLVNSA